MLLDDIASILDDVAVMTKTAASKTVGVLGDDLALNAQQVSGLVAKRELPVVWAVTKGSFLNKLILVPAALVINALAPKLVMPLLMLGGAYLCYEGVEKLVHHFQRRGRKPALEAGEELAKLQLAEVDEKAKIKGAIRTDFVLSSEIIAITLSVVASRPFPTQVVVLSLIAVLMTVGVYGLVAAIVKLDDLGLYLSERGSMAARVAGRTILRAAPFLMKGLTIVGTAAMFLVGGQILVHGIPALHHGIESFAGSLGGGLQQVTPVLLNGLFGITAGWAVFLALLGVGKVRGKAH